MTVSIATTIGLGSIHVMVELPTGNPGTDPLKWARRSYIEAARAIHPATKGFLLELAGQLEVMAGEKVNLDPDDPELQSAVADRLALIAARKSEWLR